MAFDNPVVLVVSIRIISDDTLQTPVTERSENTRRPAGISKEHGLEGTTLIRSKTTTARKIRRHILPLFCRQETYVKLQINNQMTEREYVNT